MCGLECYVDVSQVSGLECYVDVWRHWRVIRCGHLSVTALFASMVVVRESASVVDALVHVECLNRGRNHCTKKQ